MRQNAFKRKILRKKRKCGIYVSIYLQRKSRSATLITMEGICRLKYIFRLCTSQYTTLCTKLYNIYNLTIGTIYVQYQLVYLAQQEVYCTMYIDSFYKLNSIQN